MHTDLFVLGRVQPIASVAFVIVVVGHQEEDHRKGLIESRSGVPSYHMDS